MFGAPPDPPRPEFMRPLSVLCLVLAGWFLAAGPAPGTPTQDAKADEHDHENDHVRHLLEAHCISCHGPKRARSGLRLDSRQAIAQGGNSGLPLVVPGNASASELYARVLSDDPDLRMPLDRDPLPAHEIAHLKRWIEDGAEWPVDEGTTSKPASIQQSDHWAYRPWRDTAPPSVANTEHPIDRFVRARLQREGFAPAPEADRVTLLRRLSFDLTGLPPTTEELERFLNDDAPEAYVNLVDRLLASPSFGERWARHWLDLARYADSDGAAFDNERSVWPYRDWVIDAFNRDLPFDRFTIAQLAGDLLPDATREDRVATGFHRNTMITEEDGADDEEFRIEAVKNRVETTGTVWLGTTLNCAQCHDHKYDPISARDYYRMFAIFNNTEDRGRSQEPYLDLPTPEESLELERVQSQINALKSQLNTPTKELQAAQYAWERELAVSNEVWTVIEPLRASSNKGVQLTIQEDGSILAGGPSPDVATYAVSATTELEAITAVLLEVLPDESLPGNGPGRTYYGGFVLTDFTVTATAIDDRVDIAPEPTRIARATASYEQDVRISKGPIVNAIDNDRGTGWGIYPETGRKHEAVFVFEEPITYSNGTLLNFELEQGIGNEHTLGRFRLSLTTAAKPPRARPTLTPELDAIRQKPVEARTEAESAPLEAHFLSFAPELDPLREEIERLMEARPHPTRTLVMKERPQPRRTNILLRGDFLKRGARVTPGAPGIMTSAFHAEGPRNPIANRLDFARWLVSPENALTARVTVNRFWQQLFGRGIVESSNDFGTRGIAPSHPELLEWLAKSFVDEDWSVKALLRRIVLSQTYRQSSAADQGRDARDPYNTLLARQVRLRLEAEAIRDAALAVSGLLTDQIGGAPVHPPLTKGGNLGRATPKKWLVSEGTDRFRRSLYTWSWRTSPFPFYATFDAPPATVPCSLRQRTNTPLQALMMANDPMMLEIACGLGQRILAEADSDSQRLTSAFLLCFSREPTAREHGLLLDFVAKQRTGFQVAPEAATMLANAAQGSANGDSQTDDTEVATWTAVARVLLNLDAFVIRD